MSSNISMVKGVVAEFCPAMLPVPEQEISIQNKRGEIGKWTLHVNGFNNVRGVEGGIVLTFLAGNTAPRVVRCSFRETNNESEYKTLIVGLMLAKQIGPENI